MERNSFSNKPIKENSSNNNKLKDSWSNGEDYLSGFSWPPRSYSCSFCKREFRSAQALGGHMNVHRRDRARLRESTLSLTDHGQPSFLNLNIKPNPNPNPNFSYTLPSLVSPPLLYSSNYSSSSLSLPCSAFPAEMRKWRVSGGSVMDPLSSNVKASGSSATKGSESLFRVEEFKDYGCNEFLKKSSEYVRLELDLEIGLVSEAKEDLDLELRLGYS